MRLSVDPESLAGVSAHRAGDARLLESLAAPDVASGVAAAMPGGSSVAVAARVAEELVETLTILVVAVDDHMRRLEVAALAYAAADESVERQAGAGLGEVAG